MKAKKWEVLHSSNKMDWGTPDDLFTKIEERYGKFELDAAATSDNSKCIQYYDQVDDSLNMNWDLFSPMIFGIPDEPLPVPDSLSIGVKNVWLNPPYGRDITKWVKKAYDESQKGCQVVCLLPSRTGTKWFQEYAPKAYKVIFLKGRVKFEGAEASAPFDSVLLIFNKTKVNLYPRYECWDWKKE